jgi:hypothetical protein
MRWNKAGGFATRLNLLTHRCSLQARFFGTEPKLVEVGKLAVPTDKHYEAGQLFVHKSLGCRAIVMGSAPVHVHNTSQHQFTKYANSLSSADGFMLNTGILLTYIDALT